MSVQSVTASPRNHVLSRPSPQSLIKNSFLLPHSDAIQDKTKNSPNKRASLTTTEPFTFASPPSSHITSHQRNGDLAKQAKGKGTPSVGVDKQRKGPSLNRGEQIKQGVPRQNTSRGTSNNTCPKTKLLCSNILCPKETGCLSYVQTMHRPSSGMRQVPLESSGEKVAMCDICSSRYLNLHFCWYCQQVYFDEYNIDEKNWIQCDSCDRWTHLHCEDEKIKKAFGVNSSENVKYDCPRCRIKATSALQQQTQLNDQQKANKFSKGKKQEKLGNKLEKKQERQEAQFQDQQRGSDRTEKWHGNGKNLNSVQKSEVRATPSIKKGRTNSVVREEIESTNINPKDDSFYYSLEIYKKNKTETFPQLMARCPAPGLPLPNYVTIEDLLKSSGISLALDENSIKADLSNIKKIISVSSSSPSQGILKESVLHPPFSLTD